MALRARFCLVARYKVSFDMPLRLAAGERAVAIAGRLSTAPVTTGAFQSAPIGPSRPAETRRSRPPFVTPAGPARSAVFLGSPLPSSRPPRLRPPSGRRFAMASPA